MPVTQQGQGAASVSVAVPVPTPVVPKPKPKSQPAVVPQPQPVPAPVSMGPSPVSFDVQQPMTGMQPPRPPMSAVVMPWSPASTSPRQMGRKSPRRYAGETTEDHFHQMLDRNPEDHQTRMILADFLEERGDPRAAGYRALGKLGKTPEKDESTYPYWWHSYNYHSRDLHSKSSLLPHDWMTHVVAIRGQNRDADLENHPTRRDAEDTAALAFSRLPPERQHEIMNGPPQQMRRLPKRVVRYVNSKR